MTAGALDTPTQHQFKVRMTLEAALRAGPSHAYLLRGPRGSGKRAVARAFAAEILAAAAENPDDARRRALLDPSPHPDLVWIAPRGAQHLVEEVRERVIRAAAYRPFEGSKRVFVIEAAEAMRDESQNALLKTLEEPPDFVHLILLTSEPEVLLETVASRCQPIDFAPLPIPAIEAALEGAGDPTEIVAAARLSAGDLDRARFLLSDPGRQLRATAFELGKAAGIWASESGKATGPDSPEDWPSAEAGPVAHPATGSQLRQLLKSAEQAGEEAEAATREALEEERAAGIRRSTRDVNDEAKRVARRRRTEILDLGLELTAFWFRDLAAVASGAPEVAYNQDRLTQLQSQAEGMDLVDARQATELVQDTRRRLDLNVSEELALEALAARLVA